MANTLTVIGVVPVDPAGPVCVISLAPESSCTVTSGAFAAVGSTPEVVSVKFTLDPAAILAVITVCAKLRPDCERLGPKNELLDRPFASVVVWRVWSPPCAAAGPAKDQVTVTPAWGWPCAFFTSTTMGFWG